MIHKQRLNNRILGLVLALVMVLSMLPMSAFAADNSTALTITGGTDYTYENGVLDIKAAGTYEIKNADPTTATTDAIRVSAASGEVIVKLGGVNIRPADKPAFEITGDCETTVILKDGTENTLDNVRADTFASLQNGEKTLVITCEGAYTDNHMCSDTCGKLTARSYDGAGIGGEYQGNGSNITITGGIVTATSQFGTGIGGGEDGDGSNITISGGIVTATSAAGSAGIGGGDEGDGSNITISGGTVTATSATRGAGIGGGDMGNGSNITISGGTVTATSASWGAGIGGGDSGNGSNITISGGTVTATCEYGAGIGGGYAGNGSKITISGGTVTATSASWGAGIGGGYAGNGSNITISGGTVTATCEYGAGIGGGGYAGNGSNITISGETVTMPEVPKKDGYTVKWEKVLDTVTGDATVKAVYTEIPATDKPSSPQTGDTTNLWLWVALLFVSGGAVITLTVYDRKRRSVNR